MEQDLSCWTLRSLMIRSLFFFLLIISSNIGLSDRNEDDNLLQGLNSFRQASTLPPLAKHDNANCVADAIADQLEDQSCTSTTQSQLTSNYPKVLQKCMVDINSTRDGVVLPVCVPHRVSTLVLTNYTHSSPNSRYLNDSRFTGAGIGMEDHWTVLVLATNTSAGSFANRGCRLTAGGSGWFVGLHVVVMLLLALVVR